MNSFRSRILFGLGIDDLVEITNTFVSRLSLADRVVNGNSTGGACCHHPNTETTADEKGEEVTE